MSDTLSSAKPAQHGKFSLWQLFVFTTLVCVAGACLAWAREHPEALLFFVATAFATLVFTFYTLTGWPTVSIAASVGVVLFLGCLLLPGQRGSREAMRRMQCSNHLKQIGLALQNYHDTFGCFPPAYLADASGKPMHSWRVLILPFLEQKALYAKYRFDEPWDGPNNRKLHTEIVHAYSCPSQPFRGTARFETTYLAVVGPKTMWPDAASTTLGDVTDGTASTLLVAECVNSGIHWMEPRDLDAAKTPLTINATPGPSISSVHPNVALAVFVDGHTAALSKNTPSKTIQDLMTIAGGEVIGDY